MKLWLDRLRWLALAVIAVAAAFHYRSMFKFTAFLFNDPLEDMSHGWVVPLVSLFVMWRHRRELRAAAGRPSWLGALCVCFFLAVAWLGGRGGQSRIEQVSFIGLVWAIPYAFWGGGVERLMRFPAAYLLFTVPVSSFIDFFTIHLRMASVSVATGLLNGVGLAVERSGTAIFSHAPGGSFNVDVADPCSGIRSLFAMMTLMAAYAYFTQKGVWKKVILFACSLPIAVIGNIVRIISICVIASWFGQDVATGYYHDYSGFVTFVVGVCLMISLGEWVRKAEWRPWSFRAEKRASGGQKAASGGPPSSVVIVAGVTAAALAVFTACFLMPPPEFGSTTFVSETLPERVGTLVSDVPWFCQDPQCLEVAEQRNLTKETVDGVEGYACPACGKRMAEKSLGEATVLPKDTVILKRNYRSSDGVTYAVNMVLQGWSRNSIHRAELCLPSQGFIMEKARRETLALAWRERPLMVRHIDAHRPDGGARMPVKLDGRAVWIDRPDVSGGTDSISLVYWFLSRERECCSHMQRILTDVWDRSIHNRINRWVMVAVNVSPAIDAGESREQFEAFVSDLYKSILMQQ